MPQVDLGPVRLYYERTAATGEPVVLLHGSWTDHHTWDALVPPLAPALEVVVVDRRGHGSSYGPPREHPVRDDAHDLAELLSAIDLFPVHLVAHSYAGAVALRLAFDRPEMVRSLSLHEPPFVGLLRQDPAGRPEADRLIGETERLADLVRAGEAERAARALAAGISMREDAWDRLPGTARGALLKHADRWAEELGDPEAISPDPAGLEDLWLPVLLSSGGRSPPFLRRINELLGASLRNALLRELPDCGHLPQVSCPARYAGLLGTFLLERNVPVS